eukprot:6160874-Alexandrium_andersonii.AAC.1
MLDALADHSGREARSGQPAGDSIRRRPPVMTRLHDKHVVEHILRKGEVLDGRGKVDGRLQAL